MLSFEVGSASSGEVYNLVAYRTADGVRFSCTCQAGENGLHCKHRIALLSGDHSGLVSTNTDDVPILIELARASPIAPALDAVIAAEVEVAQAQGRLKKAKKLLATALFG